MLLAFEVVLRLRRGGLDVTVMVSQSRDGELGARVVEPWGVRIHRGSASRGGQAGIRGLYRDMVHHGASPVLLPDGPRGPLYDVKPGLVVLSQMTQAPLLPIAFAPRRSVRLGSWDRMHLALPLTRIAVAVGEPMQVPRELPVGERERLRREVGEELQRLAEVARSELLASR